MFNLQHSYGYGAGSIKVRLGFEPPPARATRRHLLTKRGKRAESCRHRTTLLLDLPVGPEVGDRHGQDAVEDVDADLGLGPVEHGGEPDDVWVFELSES